MGFIERSLTAYLFGHFQKLIVCDLVADNNAELGPFVEIKQIHDVLGHVVRVRHANYVVPVTRNDCDAVG